MATLISTPTRILFFTGKGGVGKTSAACATAIGLADAGQARLLVSTDPASNLDEVLGVALGSSPTAVPACTGLAALNIDPEQAARAYRERVVGPYRGVLPGRDHQHGGAAVGRVHRRDRGVRRVLEAARRPRGHRRVRPRHLRHRADRPHAALARAARGVDELHRRQRRRHLVPGAAVRARAQKALYAASNAALRDPAQTTLVLVARPDRASLTEAERTRGELAALGVGNVRLIVNGVFRARDEATRPRWRWPPAVAPRSTRCRRRAARAAARRRAAAPVRPGRDRGAARDGRADRRRRDRAAPADLDRRFAGERLDALIDELAPRGKPASS
jgi:arsenite-transporting ATPase